MKKISKIIYSIIAVALVLGIIGLTAGAVLGARPSEFLSINWKGIHLNLNLGEDNLLSEGEMAGKKQGGSFLSEEIDSLKISMGRGDMNILPSEDNTVIYYEGQGRFSCEQKGKTLVIKDNGFDASTPIELYLPRKVFEQVEVELGAGRMDIADLSADRLKIELGLGSLEAEHLEAIQELEVQVGAGRFWANSCIGKKIDLECGVGSIELTLAGKETDYDYTLECGIGNISYGNRMLSGLGKEKKIDNQAEWKINAECGMGQIDIDFLENTE